MSILRMLLWARIVSKVMLAGSQPKGTLVTLGSLLISLPVVLANVSSTFAVVDPPSHPDVPPPDLPTSCYVNSFGSPILEIHSFYSTQDDGVAVRFNFSTSIDAVKFDCSGHASGIGERTVRGDCDVVEGDSHHTSEFTFDISTRSVDVYQTWTCNDNKAFGDFAGTGTGVLPLECDGETCRGGGVRLLMALLKPVAFTPYIPPPPDGHDTPGCASAAPAWDISHFEWRMGGRGWQNPVIPVNITFISAAAHIKINMTNRANGQDYSCDVSPLDSRLANITEFPYDNPSPGPIWVECEARSPDRNYMTRTNFQIDTVARTLSIDQTWYCDDEDVASPVQRVATGTVALPELECQEREVFVPDDHTAFTGEPVINGSTCGAAAGGFAVAAGAETRNEMAPYALALPRPGAESCTLTSFDPGRQRFELDLYFKLAWWYFSGETRYVDADDGRPAGGLSWVAYYAAGGARPVRCDGWDSRLNPNGTTYDPRYWFACLPHPDDPAARGARANFDPDARAVTLQVAWACADKSPGRPIAFNATGRLVLPDLACEHSHSELGGNSSDETRCEYPKEWDNGKAALPLEDIRWAIEEALPA
ncbi:hypothetical protein GGS23DRAFT_599928 [Durotheca rogersii]|uniref:uncharacterized protein n=1 Tax=Durotheca rogersii TaxID=419775 RepID=UPI00221F45BE|nr:uncharacterized protein GGS23DRAFT_599928 [Durotheca rogersii]KAI5860000.1 hypothetical protein GGS23DRAFT_599928 [Durotheca rogersii]